MENKFWNLPVLVNCILVMIDVMSRKLSDCQAKTTFVSECINLIMLGNRINREGTLKRHCNYLYQKLVSHSNGWTVLPPTFFWPSRSRRWTSIKLDGRALKLVRQVERCRFSCMLVRLDGLTWQTSFKTSPSWPTSFKASRSIDGRG